LTLLAGSQIGKYVVQRKLAEGGMAEILLASSFGPEGFEKQVIIKRIRPGLASDPAFVKMFVSEARLVSQLNHSNIVQVFDFDRHEDTFYIAMEYVRGVSLAQAHERSRERGLPIPSIVAAQIAVEVARGLGFAHRLTENGEPLGIVHRDVTPHNILISYEGSVKLTDFGIAKAGTRASTVGMLKGKFAYMSPEQSRGEAVDARTDVFALGITLWEVLTGKQLFDADSDIAVLRAVQERAVIVPEQFNPSVDPGLGAIVMRCLERERSARYQSSQELERALNRFVIDYAERSEEIELAAWMRSLFPAEAARTERTVVRHTPVPGQLEGIVAAVGAPGGMGEMAGVASSSPYVRPIPLRSESGARTSPSGATPILPAQRVWEESPTRRTARVLQTRTPWVITAATAGVVFFILAMVYARSLDSAQDGSTPVSRTAPPTAVALHPSTPAAVTPPPVTPPVVEAAPAPAPAEVVQAPVSIDSARPAAAVASARKVVATASKPTVPELPGTLELTVAPTGEVFIDGKSRGQQTGTAKYELPPGDHQIDIKGAVRWGPKNVSIQSNKVSTQSAWVN
jgi:tRNA A-37 threonylcarbamoyl transferase component Bud32